MLAVLKGIDKYIPLWEAAVIFFALFAIVLVLVLWWAFGYNLIIVPEPSASVMKPASLAATLL
ncbi:MAG: hypothetical protein V1875_03200 [Candidatus Altiarchaeota archaeon]